MSILLYATLGANDRQAARQLYDAVLALQAETRAQVDAAHAAGGCD